MPVDNLQPKPKSDFFACFERYHFSNLFEGTRFHAMAQFAEIGSELSLAGDIATMAFKASRTGVGLMLVG